MPLNDAKIRSLQVRNKPNKVSDFDGLFLLVRTSGSKSWRFKYRLNRKEGLLVMGDYPAISVAQARKIRDAARAEVAAGNDPNESKRELARIRDVVSTQTFAAQAKLFMVKADKEGRASSTMSKTKWLLDMAIADFGNNRISEVTAPMVLSCLRKVEARGKHETARRLRAKIGGVFRFAVATGVAETDPTYALRDAIIRPTVTPRAASPNPRRWAV